MAVACGRPSRSSARGPGRGRASSRGWGGRSARRHVFGPRPLPGAVGGAEDSQPSPARGNPSAVSGFQRAETQTLGSRPPARAPPDLLSPRLPTTWGRTWGLGRQDTLQNPVSSWHVHSRKRCKNERIDSGLLPPAQGPVRKIAAFQLSNI